jgi:NAD(P)-dependent dehydrogenase (short-subunit alcohol dehydrogenase family)
MRLGLDGRTAIVSGGSRGIGFAIARTLAAEGVSVMLAARNPGQLETAASGIDALYPGRVAHVSADMTDPAEVARVVASTRQRFGPVHIAISNVIGHVIDPATEGDGPGAGTFRDMEPTEYRREFQQLAVSAWALLHECLPDMREAGWGRICNIGSGVARETATELPHVLPNVVRPAVAGIYRLLAARLAPTGVTINNILTGSILTERNLSYWRWLAAERGATIDMVTSDFHARIPLRRQGHPEEMAALVAFLCSDLAGRITGQSIPVDGGISRHL